MIWWLTDGYPPSNDSIEAIAPSFSGILEDLGGVGFDPGVLPGELKLFWPFGESGAIPSFKLCGVCKPLLGIEIESLKNWRQLVRYGAALVIADAAASKVDQLQVVAQ